MNNFSSCKEDLVLEDREDLVIHNIIDSICSLLSGDLCTINETSEKLFYDYVKSSPIDRSAFSYNWPYIVQATRKNGFCYQSKQSIVYFYLRKNPNDFQPPSLIIVNHLGYDSEASVCEIAEAAKKLNLACIVKNIDQSKLFFLEQSGLQRNRRTLEWLFI